MVTVETLQRAVVESLPHGGHEWVEPYDDQVVWDTPKQAPDGELSFRAGHSVCSIECAQVAGGVSSGP
jgi:hypothetical protein